MQLYQISPLREFILLKRAHHNVMRPSSPCGDHPLANIQGRCPLQVPSQCGSPIFTREPLIADVSHVAFKWRAFAKIEWLQQACESAGEPNRVSSSNTQFFFHFLIDVATERVPKTLAFLGLRSTSTNHEVFIHETLVVHTHDISQEVDSLREGFALEHDVGVQFCSICYAEKHHCETELLIASREKVNLSGTSWGGGGGVVYHIKIDGRLVRISYLTYC